MSDPVQVCVSIVVPVHNESRNIEPLITEIEAATAERNDVEIIYVDDGSTDDTLAVLKALSTRPDSKLRILHHASSRGQSMSLLSGVKAARGELIATLDGDGQNMPADIPKLLEIAEQQLPDQHFCIAGERQNRQDSEWRRVQSRIANRLRNALLDDGTLDTGCSLKVIPRHTWLRMPAFDHMHRFLPALVRQLGGEVFPVPVGHRPRQFETSKYGLWNRALPGVVDLMGVLWLKRRTVPGEAREIERS